MDLNLKNSEISGNSKQNKGDSESQKYFQQNEKILFIAKASYYNGDNNQESQLSNLEIFR